tara:strand:+ start:2133 stop:2876 length:744 start_codon:yes stop_codon:yes gene_type:complete
LINVHQILALLELPDELSSLVVIRHSNKAKNVIFKFSIGIGFELVLPRFYDDDWILEKVNNRKLNILSNLRDIDSARGDLRPSSITISSVEEDWKLIYKECDGNISEVREVAGRRLEIIGNGGSLSNASLLQEWLHDKAVKFLPPRLHEISEELGLPFRNIRIKRQKTLWGSCSAIGNINLNQNLMLMPIAAVDYVMHHELTHLKVLDHSEDFWRELRKVFPNIEDCKSMLKNKAIPLWAIADCPKA